MPSLLDAFAQTLDPTVLGLAGKMTGLNSDQISKGFGVVGPLLQAEVARAAGKPEGLAALTNLMPKDAGSAILGNLEGAMMRSGTQTSHLVKATFGGGLAAVGSTLKSSLGFEAGPLLSVATPAFLGALSRTAKERNLDPSGVAAFLQSETKRFIESGDASVPLVQAALASGEQARTLKAKFGAAEWSRIRLSPLAVFALVAGAARSGIIGSAKELKAGVEAVASAGDEAPAASLVNVAFSGGLTEAERENAALRVPQETLFAQLGEAIRSVEAKSPDDAAGYRAFLMRVATKVAEGAREGGFLGIGGELVSEAEHAVLDEIRGVLGA